MKQSQEAFTLLTTGEGFFNITHEVTTWVSRQDIHTGILTIFSQHTSAGLVIQENADTDVMKDLITFFKYMTTEVHKTCYQHTTEGSDDMPAHIKTALTGTHVSIPVCNNCVCLGVWQGIYLAEYRQHPHARRVIMHLIGI